MFGHDFLTIAHRMMILVSRTMLSGPRIPIVPFIFLSSAGCTKHLSIQIMGILTIFQICNSK